METPGKALIRKRFGRALDTYSEAADIQQREDKPFMPFQIGPVSQCPAMSSGIEGADADCAVPGKIRE